jgi:outer membrane protein
MKKYSVICICLFLNTIVATAQSYLLDLNKSIELAKEKSLDMKSLVQDFKIAEYNLKAATSKFKTQVSMNFVSPQYTETIRQFEDSTGISFYPVKQLNYQGNLLVNKQLPTDGYVYMRSGVSNFDDFNSSIRSTYLNTRFGLVQPLDALYGYNETKSALKQAKLAYESSHKSLKRAELDLVYRVTQSFYNLLLVQKSEEIARMDLDRQSNAYEISQNKFAAGLIREVDALQMEVDLAESKNNYDLSIVNVSSSMNYFKEIVGLNFTDSISFASELKYEVVIVDTQKAVDMALKNRLEIREQDIQLEINKMNLKRQRAQGMVKADLTAYYEKIGVNTSHVDTDFQTAFSSSLDDFKKRPQNYGVGINISVPILDWGQNKALVNAAKSRLQKTEIQKEELQRSIEREVRNLVSDLNSSLKRLQLLEKNLVVAEKSFEITRQRFADGDIDSQALALERNRLNNAYNSHLSAYIKYQLMLSDITRKTFYDFKLNEEIK